MSVLLIAEASSLDATAKALTAAKKLGPVTVLVAGAGVDAAPFAALDGVAKVLVAEDAAYAHGLAEPLADLVVSLAGGVSHIVAPSTAAAKNVAPRIAALLDVMVLSDVIGIVDGDTFERPIYAGNAIQTVKSSDKVKVITVRTTAFEAAGAGAPAPIEAAAPAGDKGLSAWIRGQGGDLGSSRADLGEDRRLGRPRRRLGRELRDHRGAGRQARRGGRCLARGGR